MLNQNKMPIVAYTNVEFSNIVEDMKKKYIVTGYEYSPVKNKGYIYYKEKKSEN